MEMMGLSSNSFITSDLRCYTWQADATGHRLSCKGDIRTGEILYGADLCMRGRDGWYNFPLVTPVDSEIVLVHRDHRVTGVQFAHADQTQVG